MEFGGAPIVSLPIGEVEPLPCRHQVLYERLHSLKPFLRNAWLPRILVGSGVRPISQQGLRFGG
jgi:hypothetical protein